MFKKMFTIVLLSEFLILCLIVPTLSHASGLCCQLSSGVQESLAGVTAPASGDISLQLNYSYTKMDKYKEGRTTRSLQDAQAYTKPDGTRYTELPINMNMVKYTMTVGYGFSQNLKAFVSLPYLRNTMNMTMGMDMGMTTEWMDMAMAPVSGVGDATLMGLFRLYSDRELRPSEVLTLGFGVKTVTGSSTERNAEGTLVHAHMQPGTGSWDPLISVIYSKMIDQVLLMSDATYQYTTRNRLGYEFGDSLAVTVQGKYAVIKQLNLGVGLTYLRLGRAHDWNEKYYDPLTNDSLMDDPVNTGGQSIWLSPSLQVFPVPDFSIEAKLQFPIWEQVNGIQLVSRYRFLAGISYSF